MTLLVALLTMNEHSYFPEIYDERIKYLLWLWFSGIRYIVIKVTYSALKFSTNLLKADSDTDQY